MKVFLVRPEFDQEALYKKGIPSSQWNWDLIPSALEKIEAFEARHKLRLPNDYRTFMLMFNGARIYPNSFGSDAIPEYILGGPTFLDPLYDWDYAEELSNGDVFYDGTPPGMLFIGGDPGGLEVLLSLREKTFGQIYAHRPSYDHWCPEREASLYPFAPSFSAFLDSLYDEENHLGYDYWYREGFKHLVRRFTLDDLNR